MQHDFHPILLLGHDLTTTWGKFKLTYESHQIHASNPLDERNTMVPIPIPRTDGGLGQPRTDGGGADDRPPGDLEN